MEKIIKLNNQNVFYSLKINKRSRNIRLTIRAGGDCVVTAPRYIPQFVIDKFLISKSDWIIDRIKYFSKFEKVSHKSKKEKRDNYLKYKEEARLIVQDRLQYFNTFYNYKWKNIVIRNQKTRWGSCSKKGNLNFNYKIALLPPEQTDYIVVHELCRLKEMNHSQKFWDLVSKSIPGYLEIRKELRKSGQTLG